MPKSCPQPLALAPGTRSWEVCANFHESIQCREEQEKREARAKFSLSWGCNKVTGGTTKCGCHALKLMGFVDNTPGISMCRAGVTRGRPPAAQRRAEHAAMPGSRPGGTTFRAAQLRASSAGANPREQAEAQQPPGECLPVCSDRFSRS